MSAITQPPSSSASQPASSKAAKSRSSQLPNVPTFAEAGFPGVDMEGWFGLLAPAATPASVIERLNHEVNAVIQSQEGRRFLIEAGYDIIGGAPAAFAQILRGDYERFSKIIKDAGIKAE